MRTERRGLLRGTLRPVGGQSYVDGAVPGKHSSTARGQGSQRRRFDARHRDICWAIARGLCVA
ncbi:hypothetical protein PsYK624_158680 [Phanerochaete sordida]|uniref:Uncharacterized protein n=1 Tax=Phanerochaete sordida TaxID=48140 RepID=A0A9P3GTR1_9APHY|nr:hypothetical protein PsYK624_158680 [Phanerochaete sordida]